MNLNELKRPAGQVKNKRRIGQGMGTGRSKYAGRGAKGQKSISGYSKMRGFEGGQMPLHRRLPKRGFTNPFREEYAIINLGTLEKLEGDTFDAATLKKSGIVKSMGKGLKVLAGGELKRKISVTVTAISEKAAEKIKSLGGTVEVLPERKPYIRVDDRATKRAAKQKPRA
jgi:large subunit ribosomal protein L15